jgi:hypothetical protein
VAGGAGLGVILRRKKNPMVTKQAIKIRVPKGWKAAIRNPAMACPITEADNHVPWFHVVAFCN